MAPGEALTQYRHWGPGFCHYTKKNFRERRKDLAKHGRFIKAEVGTQEVRVGDIRDPDAPRGLDGEFLLNVGNGVGE